MQMHQLRYVLEIAKEKNISAAAKNLFLSQPSLSQQVINLEKELGITLFTRHSKSVTLTDAGEQFVKSAQRILNEVHHLTDLMDKYSRLQSGTLHIGMLWVAGYLKLSNVLTEYNQLYPGITYSLKIDGSKSLLQMLYARSINAAFMISTEKTLQKKDELYYHRVIDDHFVAILSVHNPMAMEHRISLGDLHEENIIMPAQESPIHKNLAQIFDHHSITPRIICETSQSDLVMQLAAQNLGIGFASNSIAQSLKTDDVRILPLEEFIPRTIYYVTLKEMLDYPAVRSFTEFVANYDFGMR